MSFRTDDKPATVLDSNQPKPMPVGRPTRLEAQAGGLVAERAWQRLLATLWLPQPTIGPDLIRRFGLSDANNRQPRRPTMKLAWHTHTRTHTMQLAKAIRMLSRGIPMIAPAHLPFFSWCFGMTAPFYGRLISPRRVFEDLAEKPCDIVISLANFSTYLGKYPENISPPSGIPENSAEILQTFAPLGRLPRL